MKPGKKHTEIVGITALSTHLGITRETAGRYVELGVFERRPDGDFDQTACRLRLVRHLLERKPLGSDFRNRYDKAKALREERRAALEARELCLMSDFTTTQSVMTGLVFAGLDAAASRLHPTDRAARKRVEEEFTILKACVSEAFKRLADDLTADPVSLMPTDIPAIRQRLFGRPAPLPLP
jgi:hypothetical protein